MIWFIIALITVVFNQTTNLDSELKQIGTSLSWANRHADVRELALAIDQYRKLTGQYPPSLSALANEKGFEHTPHLIRPDLQYRVENGIGTSIVFDRAALVAWRGDRVANAQQSIDKNGCGSGDFKTNGEWCPENAALFSVFETRSYVNQDKIKLRLSLDKTVAKFINGFDKKFPTAAGNAQTLARLTNYLGSAKNCSGPFYVGSTLLTCQDLFTPWGEDVMYNRLSDTRIALVGEIPHKEIVGGTKRTIHLAQDISL